MIVRLSILMTSLLVLFLIGGVVAQQPAPAGQPECQVPIYKGGDADRKARILAKPDPEYTAAERRQYYGEFITLRAVLCGEGKVTDISVKSGLAPAIDEKAVAAAKKIKFVPGEKDNQPISTLVTLLYRVK